MKDLAKYVATAAACLFLLAAGAHFQGGHLLLALPFALAAACFTVVGCVGFYDAGEDAGYAEGLTALPDRDWIVSVGWQKTLQAGVTYRVAADQLIIGPGKTSYWVSLLKATHGRTDLPPVVVASYEHFPEKFGFSEGEIFDLSDKTQPHVT